jgi:DNA uptake protein ComE-like DNA-binding protein
MMTDAGVPAGTAQQVVNQFTQTIQGQSGSQQQQVTALSDVLGKNGTGGIQVTSWPRTVLQLVADKITVVDDDFLNGRINLNTAPAEVLATIPGMDQQLLSLIQAQQQAGGFASLNDLFQGTTFTAQQLQVLLGRVCVKSSVYLVRVRVRMPGSTRVYAVQSLVELPSPAGATGTETGAQAGTGTQAGTGQQAATDQAPKIMQWREVPRIPGWANWAPAPNYYGGGTQPMTSGGLLGNP